MSEEIKEKNQVETSKKQEKNWVDTVVDIFKMLLEYNHKKYGTKKEF